MTEDAENSQLTPTTSGSDVESRMAALEQRFDQLEAKLLGHLGMKSDGTAEHSIVDQAKRLTNLEERHKNLRRYTPEAREEPGPSFLFDIIVTVIVFVIAVSVSRYHSP